METIHMIWIIGAFFLALAVTFITTPVAKSFAYKVGAIDVPKDNRRMHTKPIPRLGGLAIFLGFFVSIMVFSYDFMNTQLRGMLVGAVIIVALGIFDDSLALKPAPKFLVQLVAAIVPVACGVRIERFPNFFGQAAYIELNLVLQYIVSIIWILIILNSVNLIDGLDGLAVGVSAIMTICVLAILILLHSPTVAVIAAALAGSCLGFIPYNVNPAKLFMGDTGAMFIGYILANLSILGLFKAYAIIAFAVPILIFGLPIFDMAFAAIRRILHKQSPFKGDRGHLHHKLIDLGFSQKQAVAILYATSAILGLSAVLISGEGFVKAIVVIVSAFVIVLIGSLLMYHKKKISEENENDTE